MHIIEKKGLDEVIDFKTVNQSFLCIYSTAAEQYNLLKT